MTAKPLTILPSQRIRRWHSYLVVWKFHRWLGLAGALVLVVLSLSGSLLVIHHELDRIVEPNRHTVPVASRTETDPAPLADLARKIVPMAPDGYRLFRIEPAVTADETHKIMFRGSDGRTRWSAFAHPRTGEVLWHGYDQSLITPWLLHLHMQLQAGRIGYYVTGLAGVCLVLLGVSGLYLYRDRLSALWRHPFRLHLGWRVALTDLHKWTGVASLYFVVMLGLTGTLYVLSILRTEATPTSRTSTFDPRVVAPLEPMLAAAKAQLPDAEVLRIQFPSQGNGILSILLLHRSAPPWRKFSRVEFVPATGSLKAIRRAGDASAWKQFSSMLAPLHFGFYGATWVKWAYFFGGLSPTLLAITGFLIWFRRKRRGSSPGFAGNSPQFRA
ncbi:MAG TPA: PepSY-associated TM helix domain-containing protein, partial [Opitutus sp.]|nr:PepSY-associated TM helix domain-containing protein [Opitutus sp.]